MSATDRPDDRDSAGTTAPCDRPASAASAPAAKARDAAGRAAVMARQRAEWEQHRRLMEDALNSGDMDTAKLAKLVAETLKIRQECERRAWGMSGETETLRSGDMVVTWRK
ncbi:MAG: hypothetical protein J1E80_09630 [Desulfovibrionaceae bacterium]|nr:hypothetical protein [Desulfovibrionaceae bacterium]